MEQSEDGNWGNAWPVEVNIETEEDADGVNHSIFTGEEVSTTEVKRYLKELECPHCSYIASRKDHFKRHVLRHPEQQLFPTAGTGRGRPKHHTCEHCGYTTIRKDHFDRHMMRHTGERPYSCMTCGYKTTHSVHLKRHVLKTSHIPNPKIHRNEETRNQMLQENSDVADEVVDIDSVWPVEVKIEEGQEEDQDGVATKGRRRKREEGPRQCAECGYTTMRSDHFKRHLMRHTGEKPFACSFPACEFTTSRATRLRNHMKTHTDASRPYACSLCTYKAAHLGRLLTHMKKHMETMVDTTMTT